MKKQFNQVFDGLWKPLGVLFERRLKEGLEVECQL